VVREQAVDDPVVLRPILRPVDMNPVGPGGRLELLKVGVEVSQGVLLDPRGQLAQRLPFLDSVAHPVAPLPDIPHALVV
jgi:hypothetical protein